jgi:hypothetical protein
VNRRLPVLLFALLAACSVLGAQSARAATSGPAPEVTRIARDCQEHRGTLSRPYPLRHLRAAHRAFWERGLELQSCGQAVASQIALKVGKPGRPRVAAVLEDCLGHGGRLTRRYSLETLERVPGAMTETMRTETRCLVGVYSQRNALRGGRDPRIPPRSRPRRGGDLTSEATWRRLAAASAVFRREREPRDQPARIVLGTAAAENDESAKGGRPSALDLHNPRAVGGTGRIWAFSGQGIICNGLNIVDVAAAVSCVHPDTFAVRGLVSITVTPGGVTIWGTMPDGIGAVEAITHDRRRISRPVQDNGLDFVLAKVPWLITYRDTNGRRRYIDYTDALCLRGLPCGPRSKKAT